MFYFLLGKVLQRAQEVAEIFNSLDFIFLFLYLLCFAKVAVWGLRKEIMACNTLRECWDWRDDSAVKSLYCSYRRPKFGSQHLYGMAHNHL